MTTALVGIQISGISFLDEGDDEVLDRLATDGAVNTLMLATHSFDRGVQGRHFPGPWPGHGEKSLDDHVGGSYATPHPEYYANTALPAFRAPDMEFAGVDILERILPKAHERGMKVFSWIYENPYSLIARHVPNWAKVLQIDSFGRCHNLPCFRNPDYVNWWLSLVEDQLKSYPIDGIQYGSERYGPLGNLLKGGGINGSSVAYCFCLHCQAAGSIRGIDVDRAKEGYAKLYEYQQTAQDSEIGAENGLVAVFRLLLRYPEILAWEKLWHDGFSGLQQQIYGVVKAVSPETPVGWHVWHQNSFSPLYRAENDFSEMARYSDFIKPVLYHNCAGPRLHHHIEQMRKTVLRNVSAQTAYEFYQDVLGYDEPTTIDQIPMSGLSGDYVRRETARTVESSGNKLPIYPGIDIDIPTHVSGSDGKKMAPSDVRAGIVGAFEGGASGVILSRKYSEMQLDNLAAAGNAIRELGKA